jgi:hypothetical protein
MRMGTIEIFERKVSKESCNPEVSEKVDIENYIQPRWRKLGIW